MYMEPTFFRGSYRPPPRTSSLWRERTRATAALHRALLFNRGSRSAAASACGSKGSVVLARSDPEFRKV
jgi:hypothetical protein